MEDLLTEMEVVDKRRAAGADAKRILVVGDGAALRGRQDRLSGFSVLMKLAAFASMEFLVMNGRDVGWCYLRRPFGHCIVVR
jgi:hypothetical protein